MGVTSNYSFPIPVATDLVTNGWDAINDLGVAVDTAMNTALATKKAGTVSLVASTSFSAVSSVSLATSVLTGYKGYRVLYTFTNSGNNQPGLRVRSASTDDSSGNYGSQNIISNDAAISGAGFSTSTSWANLTTTSDIGRKTCLNVELWDLNLAAATFGFSDYIRFIDQSASNKSYFRAGFNHNVATAYDGLTLIASTGTMTGDYKVWGING